MTQPTVIVSSVITWAEIQADGRASVRETFIDDQGNVYETDYMAAVGYDINARLVSDAAALTASFGGSLNGGS